MLRLVDGLRAVVLATVFDAIAYGQIRMMKACACMYESALPFRVDPRFTAYISHHVQSIDNGARAHVLGPVAQHPTRSSRSHSGSFTCGFTVGCTACTGILILVLHVVTGRCSLLGAAVEQDYQQSLGSFLNRV